MLTRSGLSYKARDIQSDVNHNCAVSFPASWSNCRNPDFWHMMCIVNQTAGTSIVNGLDFQNPIDDEVS